MGKGKEEEVRIVVFLGRTCALPLFCLPDHRGSRSTTASSSRKHAGGEYVTEARRLEAVAHVLDVVGAGGDEEVGGLHG